MKALATRSPSSIIIDACCAITLATSGEAAEILAATGRSIYMATYVFHYEIKRTELVAVISKLVTAGAISLVEPTNEIEEQMYVRLASLHLDNGECVTGAIASQRNWAVAIDERKANGVFARELPRVMRFDTPDLLFNWVEATHPLPQRIAAAVERTERQGRYAPHRTHSLHSWWQAVLESGATNTAQGD